MVDLGPVAQCFPTYIWAATSVKWDNTLVNGRTDSGARRGPPTESARTVPAAHHQGRPTRNNAEHGAEVHTRAQLRAGSWTTPRAPPVARRALRRTQIMRSLLYFFKPQGRRRRLRRRLGRRSDDFRSDRLCTSSRWCSAAEPPRPLRPDRSGGWTPSRARHIAS